MYRSGGLYNHGPLSFDQSGGGDTDGGRCNCGCGIFGCRCPHTGGDWHTRADDGGEYLACNEYRYRVRSGALSAGGYDNSAGSDCFVGDASADADDRQKGKKAREERFVRGGLMDLQMILLFLPGFLVGLTFHEAAHAITAKWLGDPTAQERGRVSLNPLRHLSPLGTVALFIMGFGWGKPVPVNIHNFAKPKFYYLLTSLAGPAVNVLIAAIALGILYLRPGGVLVWICMSIFIVNAILAVFNLLPIPPLDGSKIWPFIIPGFEKVTTGQWSGVWMVVLIAGLYTGVIGKIMSPVFEFLYGLLPGA